MKNRNLVIVILAVICAGLLAGVVYTVTKGKSGTQKKQEASAEAGADETESQSGIIEEDGKKYKLNPDIKTVLFMGVDKEEKADLGNNPGENGQSDSLNLLVLNKEEKTERVKEALSLMGFSYEKIRNISPLSLSAKARPSPR